MYTVAESIITETGSGKPFYWFHSFDTLAVAKIFARKFNTFVADEFGRICWCGDESFKD